LIPVIFSKENRGNQVEENRTLLPSFVSAQLAERAMQVEYFLFKMPGARYVLEYLYLFDDLSWELDLCLNMKFIYVSYTFYIHSPKVILENTFNNFVHETKIHGMEFSTVVLCQCPKVLEHFAFCSFELGMVNLY
jgi:hypothetical protein